jgi:DNA-binding LacI/PurR family transcriptional regulator
MVPPETVRRVQQAIEQLGWTRHEGTHQLGGGRSAAIGVVVAELSPHSIGLMKEIEDYLEDNGYVLHVVTSAHRLIGS